MLKIGQNFFSAKCEIFFQNLNLDRVVFNWQKTESTKRGQLLRMGGCD
jgi:hypothetical protein